jgi:phosphohistidine swiveling domain-containing protein
MLEFGKRVQIPSQELFMLDLNEVTQILSSSKVELPDLKERLTYYNAYRRFVSPNDFGGTILQSTAPLEAGALRGIGCSSGEITGRARVILDIHKTGALTKDEILVTLFTDPGWTPVLARVGGVITEVGGLLSHAAVIGREYGIPAILNVNGATKLIKDGSLIRINGKTGVIEILEESP